MENKSEEIEAYCIRHSSSPIELINQVERETHLKTTQPNMISGFIQGHFIGLMISLMRAKRVLEIGTFTGYTSLWIAENLQADSLLYTLEINPESHWLANSFFEQYEHKNKIKSLLGDAKILINNIDEKWDFVLIDAAKMDNDVYYEMILPHVNKNGIIAIDNVLWKGKILEELNDKRSRMIDDFNKKIALDPRVSSLMLPLRDGLTLVRKL